jgi:ribosomal protein L32
MGAEMTSPEQENKRPIYKDDGKPDHKLCANCGHWKVSHSAFSGCVIQPKKDKYCDCIKYVPNQEATR